VGDEGTTRQVVSVTNELKTCVEFDWVNHE
jgi:hypothetical protein